MSKMTKDIMSCFQEKTKLSAFCLKQVKWSGSGVIKYSSFKNILLTPLPDHFNFCSVGIICEWVDSSNTNLLYNNYSFFYSCLWFLIIWPLQRSSWSFSLHLNVYIPFTGLNPLLTLNTTNSGTVLIDLSPDDKEFQSVEEEVEILILWNAVLILSCFSISPCASSV